MPSKINIAIADDHELFLDGLKLLLIKEKELKIVGTANNGVELLQLVRSEEVDVVLTDINMPIMNGTEATKEIKHINKNIEVIALSMFDDEKNIIEMIQMGASGYILKGSAKKEILEAIHLVYNKEKHYCKKTIQRYFNLIVNKDCTATKKDYPNLLFSSKEIDIIKKICEELTSKEVARDLDLSKRTVEGIKRRIMQKIDVKSTVGIVKYAYENKLV